MVLGVAVYEEAGAATIPIPIASEETILITRLFIVLSPFDKCIFICIVHL